MSVLNNFEPKKVLYYFEEITKIPHGSGDTDAISEYCVEFAKKHNFFVTRDSSNNVMIVKPASNGRENDQTVIIQGHLDMVNEKTDESTHDFSVDSLKLYVEDGFIKAEGTTLGADDGIAVAYALAILDSDNISHPRLEVVFTTDEEIGMVGASAFDTSSLQGRMIINIDSETEGVLTSGCAGGATVEANIDVRYCMTEGIKYNISISNLTGGHSGEEIGKERANANVLLGRILNEASKNSDIEILDICGGTKDNAIPRNAVADVVIHDNEEIDFIESVKATVANLKKEYANTDPDMKIVVSKTGEGVFKVLFKEDTISLVTFLNMLPNGVDRMSTDIAGLVETSSNLAIIKLENETFKITELIRSSIGSRKEALVDKIRIITAYIGGYINITSEYPEWSYKKDSVLRDIMVDSFDKLYGKKPKIDVIHAGLECGYFASKMPDADIVSFGPDNIDIHTPDERVSIDSIKRTYDYLVEILRNIK